MGKVSKRESRRNRASREERLEALHEAGVLKGKPVGGQLRKRLPMNMKEVRQLLSNRNADHLRHPLTEREGRYWDRKLWTFRGRPYNKTPFKGDSKKRKLRQRKRSKRWTLRNNRRKKAA